MKTKRTFKVKDLILTAALALCSIIIFWICGVVGLSPYTLLALAPLWALVGGIVFYLAAVKTKSPYMMFIFCFISGLNGFSVMTVTCGIVSGLVIMMILSKTSFENMKVIRLCYILFTVIIAAGAIFIPLVFFTSQTMKQYAKSIGESYMEIVASLASPPVVLAVLAVTVLTAFLGGGIAQKLLKKHFQKAGAV